MPHQSKIHMKEPTQFLIKKNNSVYQRREMPKYNGCVSLRYSAQIVLVLNFSEPNPQPVSLAFLSSSCSPSYPQMKQSKSQAGFRISHWVEVWHNSIFVKSIPTWDSNHILSFYLLSSTVWNWVWWNWVCGLCIYNEFVFWTFCSLRNFIKHNKGSKHSKLAAAKNLHNKHKY